MTEYEEFIIWDVAKTILYFITILHMNPRPNIDFAVLGMHKIITNSERRRTDEYQDKQLATAPPRLSLRWGQSQLSQTLNRKVSRLMYNHTPGIGLSPWLGRQTPLPSLNRTPLTSPSPLLTGPLPPPLALPSGLPHHTHIRGPMDPS